MKKSNKKIALVTAIVGIVFVFIGISYAFLISVAKGEKNIVIKSGTLDLVLEEENEITIEDALPMYEDVDMTQGEVFNFKIVNKTDNDTAYILKLNKIANDNELDLDIVKYYLTKDKVGEAKLLSEVEDGIVDEDTIKGNKTVNYSLRFWIDSSVTDDTLTKDKSLSYKVSVEVNQNSVKNIKEEIIGQVDTTTEIDFDQISSDTNGNGVYQFKENNSDIYYYRGNVNNNHVIFAGYCWEMIRTTENGGVKMIYDGVAVDGKCTNTGDASQLSNTVAFNSKYNDNAYVGYMYGLTGVTSELNNPVCVKLNEGGTEAEVGIETSKEECEESGGKWATTAYEATHANVVNSTVKTVIDNWFENSKLNTIENLEKIEDAVYCNDRSIDTTYATALGYGTNSTAYMVKNRLGMNKTPTLSCKNENDRFTVSKSNGNGALTYPVGLITTDEMALAGGKYGTVNDHSYLTTGNYYWSMSPSVFFNYSSVMNIYTVGSMEYDGTYARYGVRPVIALKSSVNYVSGDGSSLNPFIVG